MTNLISIEDRTDRVEDSSISLRVDKIEEYKDQLTKREQAWLSAWCAVAINAGSKSITAEWADECLTQFDKRFTKQ